MIHYPLAAGKTLTRVLEAGRIDAPAIVLLHGLSSRADRWMRNIDALAAEGYRVIAADLPGHGFATKDPAYDHTIGGYADFVLALFDALRLDKATLVGTSLGGHIVAAAALKQPQRIERLMMIGSTGFAQSTPQRAQGFGDWILNLTPPLHRPKLERVFSQTSLVTDDMVREDVLINTSPGAAECFRRFIGYMGGEMNNDLVLERLRTIEDRVPLLLFWGVDDTSVSVDIGRAAREKLPRSRLVTVTGLNHTPYYENPSLFNRVLLAYMHGVLDTVSAEGLTLL
jgi:2-hydroxy-6-oxonona-2,4-dienedioate hydrolase